MADKPEKVPVRVPEREDGKPVSTRPSDDGDGRIDRIVHETRKLSDDLMEWVNLRLKLIQLDAQERIDQELDLVFSGAIVLSMIVVALLLASFGLSFILGDLLGQLWYGFAIMAFVYVVAAIVISRMRPRLAAGFRSTWARERSERDADTSTEDQ